MSNMNSNPDIAIAVAAGKKARIVSNKAHSPSPFPESGASLNSDNMKAAFDTITSWDGYAPTPLLSLQDVADYCGIKAVYYKDESPRFGLGSFKALGGAYAAAELVAAKIAEGKTAEDVTVATATDGNHGRSVSWGSQRAGYNAKIYIHEHVSEERAAAMRAFGAEVTRVDGNYEASLAACKADALAHGWDVVSDTSWDGYLDIPLKIMAGYTVMTNEALDQMDGAMPSHAFLPVGVGGLASAVAAPLWQRMGTDLCHLISVESTMSACFLESIDAGVPTLVDTSEETLMAGLSCGEISNLAWDILRTNLTHCMAISDESVAPLMRWFSQRDQPIEAGECSTSGLAALLQAHADSDQWSRMGFEENSVVLLLGTEGATDRALYDQLIAAA